ncbi:hypothetical protein [Caulobacter hibisci]|uniref:Uncharacterized protein n=1 Tax=Caulobacter hibisci TaxID=2035993 RepID=A0ABS0SRD0_9CAUL|nr:hypothetical protein [Caulobacter hibisci]MBI1682084.1 hypothetical protein [Caulobacter hibisci]
MTQTFQAGGRPGRTPTDAFAKTFENVDVSLFDLYRAHLQKGQTVIEGRTFRNCRLEGPVVLLVLGGVDFDATDFGYTGGDIRNIVLRPASPTTVVGAVPFKDCSFIDCQFYMVGFTGPDSFLQQILALDTPK